MSDAETILRMIENVDVNDANILDEIDARVWCYLNDKQYKNHEINYDYICYPYDRIAINKDGYELNVLGHEVEKYDHHLEYRYTRSRDALKSIRPDGFIFYILPTKIKGDWVFTCNVIPDECLFDCKYLQTEELAELHAIIQAYIYRGIDETE